MTPNHHLLYSSQDLVDQEPIESTSLSTLDFDLPDVHPCFFIDNSNQRGNSNLLVDVEWELKSSKARISIPMEDEDGNPLIECVWSMNILERSTLESKKEDQCG